MSVSRNIKRLRVQAGLTQEELAEKMFVSRKTISSWETNRSQPDVETLISLADILSTDVNELIYGVKEGAYIKYQKKYINVSASCVLLIGFILCSGKYISTCYWEKAFSEDALLHYNLFVYFIPCLLETICTIAFGVALLSTASLWYDIRIKKQNKVIILCSLMIFLFIIFFCSWFYELSQNIESSFRFELFYHYWWNRLLFIWGPSFILGILLFLLMNRQIAS